MPRNATLAVGQFRCVVGDKAANLAKMATLAGLAAEQGAQFLCFPEMGLTGAAGRVLELAETVAGKAVRQLGGIARENGLHLIAGLPERDPATGKVYNACVLLGPDGALAGHYRKRCLYLGEREIMAPGEESVLCDTPFCRLALTICYDYVFPRTISQLVDAGAELICHPPAWLTTDVCEQWRYSPMAYRAMAITRALENTVFFLTANLWGNYDQEGSLRAIGQSAIIAPWGEILAEVPEGEGVAVATVDFDAAEGWRQAAAPYLADRARLGLG